MKNCLRGIVGGLLGLAAVSATAGEWVATGARLGLGDLGDGVDDYTQLGVFGTYSLPWTRTLESGGRLELGLNVELHQLDGPGDDGQLFTVGPQLEIHPAAGRFSFNLGIAPTLISEHRFTGKDMGGTFQFTSHIGVRYELSRDWSLGARIQHTSNADLYDKNQGLDLLAFELVHRY